MGVWDFPEPSELRKTWTIEQTPWRAGELPENARTRRHQPSLIPSPVPHAIELAAEAMRAQRSAHSLATGPVMALPFISPFGFTMTPALSSK